jgi:hypothetical protein
MKYVKDSESALIIQFWSIVVLARVLLISVVISDCLT